MAGRDVDSIEEGVLAQALEICDDGVAIFGPDGGAFFTNRLFVAHMEALGFSENSLTWAAFVSAIVSLDPRLQDLTNSDPSGSSASAFLDGPEGVSFALKLSELSDGFRRVSLSDVTAQRQREARAREHADQLTAILEHVPHGVSYLGSDGRLMVANDEFFEVFHFPDWMGEGTPGYEFTREILRRQTQLKGAALERAAEDRLERIYRECRASGLSQDTEYLDDGRIIEIRRKLLPEGSLVETYIDVSERESALQEARRTVGLYRAVVEDQTEMICRFDRDFCLTFANAAYRDTFQPPGEDILGKKIFDLIPDPEVSSAIHDGLKSLTPDAPVFSDTFQEVTANGDSVWQTWINRAIFAEDGTLLEYQAVGRDVSAEREARDALSQAEKLSAMGGLLASVSHELNNPLSILVGQSQLLEEISEDPDAQGRAGLIRVAAERCARIVRTFLSMARQKPPVRAPTDLAALSREAIELVAYALRTNRVIVDQSISTSPVIVEGDRDQLIQVVVNILINAQQALSEVDGERHVRITVLVDGLNAVLEISDTGPGIKPATIERIFEPFFTTKPEGVGTGIGLAVSRNIALAHGGTLECENGPEGGARFRMTLPLASRVTGEAGLDDTVEIWRGLSPLSVLFVDDEAGIADTVRDILETSGHRMIKAGHGREALDVLGREKVDILITDVRMPVMDGPALWAALKENRLHPLSAVGVVTGDTLSPDVQRFLDDTGVPVAEKPLTTEDIKRLIVTIISADQ